MTVLELYLPGKYENPLSASGRARTLAAFHIAQGDVDVLSTEVDMRRDVLNGLMSPSAVNYWLNTKEWLEKSGKAGRVQLLRLTSKGLLTCRNSVAGGADMSTTAEQVMTWRNRMKHGGPSFEKVTFQPLPQR